MKIDNWKFTKDYDTFVSLYQHLVGNIYEVYDRDSENIYKAEVTGFKKHEHYNTIECVLPEDKRRKLHINENYININNEDFWFAEKIHKDCTTEFEEKYSYLYGSTFLCYYNGVIDSCLVKSLDNTSCYHPKFKCKLLGINKTVSLHLSDINYNNVSETEWESLKEDPKLKENRNKFKKYFGKTFEAFVSSGVISTITIEDACVNDNLLCKTLSGAFKEIKSDRIAFKGDLFKCAYTVPDYTTLYKRKYKDIFGTSIEIYRQHSFQKVLFKDIIYYNSNSLIVVCDAENNHNIQLSIDKTELSENKDWKKPLEIEIEQYNKSLAEKENAKKRISEITEFIKSNTVEYSERLKLIKEFLRLSSKHKLLSGKTYNVSVGDSVVNCVFINAPKLKKDNAIYNKNVTVKKPSVKKKIQTYIFNIDLFSDNGFDSFRQETLRKLQIKEEEQRKVEEKRRKKQQEQQKQKQERQQKQQEQQKKSQIDEETAAWYEYELQMNDYYEARMKNENLVDILDEKRSDICGIGTRKLKLFLNKMIKTGDHLAELYRTALEIEDANISAKKYRGSYKDDYYNKKVQYLGQLIKLCKLYKDEFSNSLVYGKELSDDYSTNAIIYFELPNCEQISFHTNLSKKEKVEMPNYGKPWDGKVNSTMGKLETAIMKVYKDKIEEYIK